MGLSKVICSSWIFQVFLQSDIEAVSGRMREEFLKFGKGKLAAHEECGDKTNQGWLRENPFGVMSDWEQHVIDRGAPMYRLMLSKSTTTDWSGWYNHMLKRLFQKRVSSAKPCFHSIIIYPLHVLQFCDLITFLMGKLQTEAFSFDCRWPGLHLKSETRIFFVMLVESH